MLRQLSALNPVAGGVATGGEDAPATTAARPTLSQIGKLRVIGERS
jgi:hypothetical protein